MFEKARVEVEAWRTRSTSWKALWIGIALLVLLGTYGLLRATNALVAGLALTLAALVAWPKFDEVFGRLLGAVLIAAVGLAGFNVLVDRVVRLPIVVGLGVAVMVFGLVATWYLWGARWGRTWKIGAGAALAVLVIIGVPLILGITASKSATERVEVPAPVASRLDVLIVTSGRHHPVPREVPPDAALLGFDVHFAVGVAEGNRVRWTLADGIGATQALRVASDGAQAPTDARERVSRPGADSVLILLVDGTAPVPDTPAETLKQVRGNSGEVDRWRRIASAASSSDMPIFALLQTRGKDRLQRWARFTADGAPVSIQSLASPSVTDAAVRLAVAAPGSRGDYSLAVQYRPVLLFDSREPVPRPMSIETLFSQRRVRLCHDDRPTRTVCDEPIANPAQLVNGGTHLGLSLQSSKELRRIALSEQERARAAKADETDEGAPPPGTPPATDTLEQPLGAGSAIYVHPVSVDRDGRHLLYLDYWWYLQDNPAETGAGAFCGAGLVIPGITCHNHQSDWEGLTVVVDRTGPEPAAVAVQYAQHNHVVRYDWQVLRSYWDGRLAAYLANVTDPSSRPLAFSARGTHATYPTHCGHCQQVGTSALVTLGENPHDGKLEWSGNDTSTCGEDSCLKLLPSRDRGHQPALWNDFAGPWGERHCEFKYYCDSGSPPAAPGRQRRFIDPTRHTAGG